MIRGQFDLRAHQYITKPLLRCLLFAKAFFLSLQNEGQLKRLGEKITPTITHLSQRKHYLVNRIENIMPTSFPRDVAKICGGNVNGQVEQFDVFRGGLSASRNVVSRILV